MSRKTKPTTMKSEKEDSSSFSTHSSTFTIPKLRFPEFRGADGWILEPLGEVYTFKGNNSLSRDKLNYVAGSVKNIHYGDIHTKFSTHFDITKELVPFINESEEGIVRDDNLCVEGDMIFADASEDMEDIGKSIELASLNGERVVSGLHTILARRIGDRIALGFGGHLFKSVWVRTQIKKEAQGAKVLGISANRMRNLRLPLPLKKAEQRKIADCLSSLDDLIAAHSKKRNTLKIHKKGLMQQLLPREGETQPRLRFPEFKGDWNDRTLGDLCFNVSSGRDARDSDGGFDLYGSTGVIGKTAKASYATPHILVARVGANAGYLTKASGQFGVTDNTLIIKLKPAARIDYIFHYLGNININKLIFGSGQPLITGGILKAQRVLLPSAAEQSKISDCLSSINDLIKAESDKLEALNFHKKGLLQQLFPFSNVHV